MCYKCTAIDNSMKMIIQRCIQNSKSHISPGAGYECSCHSGYRLAPDLRSCNSVDRVPSNQQGADTGGDEGGERGGGRADRSGVGGGGSGSEGGTGSGGGGGEGEVIDRCKIRNPCEQICKDTGILYANPKSV